VGDPAISKMDENWDEAKNILGVYRSANTNAGDIWISLEVDA
jgi:hypothetical protein